MCRPPPQSIRGFADGNIRGEPKNAPGPIRANRRVHYQKPRHCPILLGAEQFGVEYGQVGFHAYRPSGTIGWNYRPSGSREIFTGVRLLAAGAAEIA